MSNNVRLHGSAPYTIVAVHGGPGGIGEARPFAEKLAESYGVIEPFLLSKSLEGQLEDLRAAIVAHVNTPIVLIGHSYGAMLSYIFTARYPEMVRKLIMVSSGVLEEKDEKGISDTRLSRLTDEQRDELSAARTRYVQSKGGTKKQAFAALFRLVQQSDAYELLPHASDLEVILPLFYESVWHDMQILRNSGELVLFGEHIQCPVVAIHGDYDPRSAEAIHRSLVEHVKNLQWNLLERCGHYPWYEKQARDEFYAMLYRAIQ